MAQFSASKDINRKVLGASRKNLNNSFDSLENKDDMRVDTLMIINTIKKNGGKTCNTQVHPFSTTPTTRGRDGDGKYKRLKIPSSLSKNHK